jgi:hypothetical protein
MVIGAEPHCFGVRLKNRRFLDLTYCKKPRSKFVWWGRICGLHNQDRKATPIIGERSWALKLEILWTSRCHLWEVCIDSRYKGKLTPMFMGPLKITEKRGEVAYELELPPQLSDVHDVFHVSQLKKCLCVPEEQIPMEDLDVKEDLSYQEYPIKILETFERVTQNKRIKMCKVQWSHHTE